MDEPEPTQDEQGLVLAEILDGRGGGRSIGWEEIGTWDAGQGVLWMHLNLAHAETREWLESHSGLHPASVEALTADASRPRSFRDGDGLVVILRGINPRPGTEPDDMVALRMWVGATRIITLRARFTAVATRVQADLSRGEGPHDPGDFLVHAAESLMGRIGEAISAVDDTVDQLEDETLVSAGADLRTRIAALRRNVIGLRRHLAPQRDAMKLLMAERVPWFDDVSRVHMREIADRVTRSVEDLDSARDRAAVTQEELTTRLSEQMNQTMYRLSIITAIFLPLGLLTGLLGINVGGMPGVEDPLAFWIVCALLLALSVLLFGIVRWRKLV